MKDMYDQELSIGDMVAFVAFHRTPGKGYVVAMSLPDFPNDVMVESILLPGRRMLTPAYKCFKI